MSINTPTPPARITAGPHQPAGGPGAVGDHVRHLREDGGTYRGIAAAAGVAPATVHDLVSGRPARSPSRGSELT